MSNCLSFVFSWCRALGAPIKVGSVGRLQVHSGLYSLHSLLFQIDVNTFGAVFRQLKPEVSRMSWK